jgi:hypothetical protein
MLLIPVCVPIPAQPRGIGVMIGDRAPDPQESIENSPSYTGLSNGKVQLRPVDLARDVV